MLPPTESETTGTVGNLSRGSRETPATNGKPEEPKVNVSTAEQQTEIETLTKDVRITIKEILTKMKLTWPPDKLNAEKIIKRLKEKKLETAKK